MRNSLLGKFKYVDTLIKAARGLHLAGYKFKIFSPIPLIHEIEAEFGPSKAKRYLRYFTLIGAIAGFIGGTFMAISTALLYILPRGGRPIISITPTLLISYETTILAGVLMTLVGFVILAGLPSFNNKIDDPDIGSDTFGLLVEGVREDRFEDVRGILLEHDAYEVKSFEED
ncbi:MAG: hypothetical protein BMS9Abin23_0004 [Thermodesulfobacteriota bacterium]|nr:MAG: hypothetical protein BMS9Abin23_0004 [Thermodesulfobacteriota bacterium]